MMVIFYACPFAYEFKMDSLNSNREKRGNINFLDIQVLGLGLYSTFLGLYLGLYSNYTVFSSGSICHIYRVTDEALIAETAVWPNFFLMNVFFALKGSKLFIIIRTLYSVVNSGRISNSSKFLCMSSLTEV